jgi:hypothetical protein
MTRALPRGVPSRATGKAIEHRLGRRHDIDDIATPQLAKRRRLYDTALERSAVGDRSLQRYLAVLIAPPRPA